MFRAIGVEKYYIYCFGIDNFGIRFVRCPKLGEISFCSFMLLYTKPASAQLGVLKEKEL